MSSGWSAQDTDNALAAAQLQLGGKSKLSKKNVFVLAGGLLVLFLVFVGYFFFRGFSDRPQIEAVVTNFLLNASGNKYEEAYTLTSAQFRTTYPMEDFVKSLTLLKAQYAGFASQGQGDLSIKAVVGQPTEYHYSGMVAYEDDDSGTLGAILVKEGDDYKISSIDITVDTSRYDKFAQKDLPALATPAPFITPILSPADTQTLAPAGTTEYGRKRYRATKTSMTEAQTVQKRIGNTFGSIEITNESVFTHSEIYKGIAIKWTDAQAIPADRLAWIKSAIDILPPYFVNDHPIGGIYSAQHTELGLTSNPVLSGAAAYASGFNIFLTSNITKPGTLYQVGKPEVVRTLFHEWMHVVQHYEILQTFTEEYLSIPGNLIVVMPLLPFNKDFAKSVGWEFVGDEYAESTFAKLKGDAESQKTTDYGKTAYVEDISETMSSFVLCDTTHMSQARIDWAQVQTGNLASGFCPAKI